MESYTELNNVLNDLILTNTDRVRELKNRMHLLGNNSGLAPLFNQFIKESEEFKEQLMGEVTKKGGTVLSKGTGNSGGIYHSWKELKNWLLLKKDLSILEKLQFDTKVAFKIYKEALFAIKNIPADTLDLIATQKARLRVACRKIETELLLNNSSAANFFS